MVAAENDKLPNCKVGGVADVVRDIPTALSKLDQKVSVIVPDYGQVELHREFVADIGVPYRQHLETATLWRVSSADDSVTQYVIGHSLFSSHGGAIYCNDSGDRPFATDASKYAFFSAAVCEVIEHQLIPNADVVHLHDWHAATVAVLAKYSGRFNRLKQTKLVYTVHNLALQGVRPFKGDGSSLEAWFPTLSYDGRYICDHHAPHCYNPMRAGIVLCDKVHVVSPTYAQEVMRQSIPEEGFFGGERLEIDMQHAAEKGKLHGIINGCEYEREVKPTSLSAFYLQAEALLFQWMSKYGELRTTYYLAHQRILKWQSEPSEGPLVTSVGRLTDQKALLLRQPYNSKLALDELANRLAQHKGRMIILGSGDGHLEYLFTQVMGRNPNVLFLNGYGNGLGDMLYQLGDLFLMPSSFEPCGISQMLAMRDGQPCLVHQVGGLADTVQHEVSGYCFAGNNFEEQVENMLNVFSNALHDCVEKPEKYNAIRSAAKSSRFAWGHVAKSYIDTLYH
ncbi:Glycogen synthase, ADP-glucose transglucosylase [Pseudoalteromonas luteoviolacea B = ATCC 29581]|nr:Glycogen synthase, ADP-glucose transglucosylase [Pseudoalteromonas luteoviolacea B = ATCC 29581]